MLNNLENIGSLPPDVAIRVLDLAKTSAAIRKQELANTHEHNKLILEQRERQFERSYTIKMWSLIVALIVTCFSILGGIYLVMMNHEMPGMVAIASGAGLTLVGAIFKVAEKLMLQKFSDTDTPEEAGKALS